MKEVTLKKDYWVEVSALLEDVNRAMKRTAPIVRVQESYRIRYLASLLTIDSAIWSETLDHQEKTVEFHWPATWFQHLKMSHFPQWFIRKYPVRMQKETRLVTFETKAVYPNLPEKYTGGKENYGPVILKNIIK